MSVVGASYWQDAADAAASKYGIPQPIFNSLINVESAWNAYSYSAKGAIGLTQLEPGTASDMNVNPWDPVANLNGGAEYLSGLFKQFGNWPQALAAYNAGPGNIAAGQGYATQVLADAAKAGYTPTGGTTNSGPAPVTGADTLYSWLSDTFGIDPLGANPSQTQAPGSFSWSTLSWGTIALYGAGVLVLGVVTVYAVGALFKSEQPAAAPISPGDVIRGAEILA